MIAEIRILSPEDDRASFRSGDEALDLYFHRYAGQNQFRHHVGVTYVAIVASRLVGFVTVSPATIDAEALPKRSRVPFPVPVLRVARLAVGAGAQGSGIGKSLLRFTVEMAERMRAEFGCVGLVVDAKPNAVSFYAHYGFLPIEATQGVSPRAPAPVPMFLSLGSVPPKGRPRR